MFLHMPGLSFLTGISGEESPKKDEKPVSTTISKKY